MAFRTVALLPALALAAACSSTSSSVAVEPELSPYEMAVRDGHAYTMAVMRRGAATDVVSPSEMGDLTRAHIDFTQGLADTDYLLVSGPFVGERVESSLRSLAIVDSTDARGTRERFCTDPAAEAGVLEIEAFPFVATQPLRAMPSIERASRASQESGQMTLRPYVIVDATTGPEFDATLERVADLILLRGDCMGGSFESRTIAVLDCRTVSEAESLMAGSSPADGIRIHPWVSTVSLTGME
ncbi:MAG: hypothetical protein AAFP22_01960 [Planctomycetota bacterium]